MKNVLTFCIILFSSASILGHPENAKIEFKIIAKNLPEDHEVYITGNNVQLGNWTPDAIKMEKLNDSTFIKTFYFPVNTHLEFKFTKGSWETEALREDEKAFKNFSLKVAGDSILTFKIPKWKMNQEGEKWGQITGNVEYIFNLKTHIQLLPRDVIVWLPPGYYENTEQRYPVLYMHDGQNIIDPETSFLGIDWQIDETADSLIKLNKIEPMIIVGVYNTTNRRTEYSENDTGYAYIDFLVGELKPMIDKRYRTKPERENTAVAGSSMGGLISFMAAWENPEVFAKAACLSPAFKIGKYDFVDNVLTYEGKLKDIFLYIDNGGIGLEDSLQAGIDEMLTAIKNIGYQEGENFVWVKDKFAEHNESAWAERAHLFLKLFFGKENK